MVAQGQVDRAPLDLNAFEESEITQAGRASMGQRLQLFLLICAVALTRFVFRSHPHKNRHYITRMAKILDLYEI
jgi:hypothetical protein